MTSDRVVIDNSVALALLPSQLYLALSQISTFAGVESANL